MRILLNLNTVRMNTLGLVVRVKARVGCSAQPNCQFDASKLDGIVAVFFGYIIR